MGDGNEQVGAREIDKSWAEAIKNLLRYDPVDEGALPALSRPTSPRWHCSISTCRDTATPGTLYTIDERYPGSMIEKSDFVPLAHPRKLSVRTAPDVDQFMRRA
jgi:hypothetical protein